MIRLYDTLARKIRLFKPLKPKMVKLYSCGPTVYNYVHIGNLRAFVFVDLLKRYLCYRGFKIKHVMNITDVDDKTIEGSKKNNQSLKKYTDFYLNAFLEDIRRLNIKLPDVMPRATEHISEMIDLIKRLKKKGYAYRANESIYFKISKFKNYGRLAQLKKKLARQNISRRLNIRDEYKKEEANDFVLWKEWQPADGNVFWDTDLGRGRPGWHIECSAMSMKYLGKTLDIHTGGIDLVFPHHTNEIAQSEVATSKQFAKYWLHNAHLIVNGQKMSKSLGNFYTLKDITVKKYDPLLVRFILLKTHYRQKLNFTFDNFEEAGAIRDKLINFLINIDFVAKTKNINKTSIKGLTEDCRHTFRKAMDDDLNISLALSALYNFLNKANKLIDMINYRQAKEIKKLIYEIDDVLGFVKKSYEKYLSKLYKKIENAKINKLLKQREEERKIKNYKKADKIRNEILSYGIAIEDTKHGYILKITE